MKNGKFFVIEGSDGAGKATQTRLLVERLEREGRDVKTIDFPGYTRNHFGRLLRECLDGKRGDFVALDPKIASTIYALDRYESAREIRSWLQAGQDVVADRYVSANMLHQGAKIDDEANRKDFLDWLDEVEHGVLEIPHPHAIVYLDVPYETRKQWMENDVARGSLDTVEINEAYQTNHEAAAHHLNRLYPHWHHITCVDGGQLLTREAIHERVFEVLQSHLQ